MSNQAWGVPLSIFSHHPTHSVFPESTRGMGGNTYTADNPRISTQIGGLGHPNHRPFHRFTLLSFHSWRNQKGVVSWNGFQEPFTVLTVPLSTSVQEEDTGWVLKRMSIVPHGRRKYKHFPIKFSSFKFLCVFRGTWVHACMERPEINLGCGSMGTIHLVYWDKFSHWPEIYQVG